MTVTENPDTSQVRDLIKVFKWLDEKEAEAAAFYEGQAIATVYQGNEDEDFKKRLFMLLFDNSIRNLLRLNHDDLPLCEYLESVTLSELFVTTSLCCEMTFQSIAEDAELENSFAIFNVNDFVPSLVCEIISFAGDVDKDKLRSYCFAPVSTFIQSTNN